MNHEKVAILVDSGSDVPAELLERYHIFMIDPQRGGGQDLFSAGGTLPVSAGRHQRRCERGQHCFERAGLIHAAGTDNLLSPLFFFCSKRW